MHAKRHHLFYFSFLIAIVFLSCNKEQDPDNEPGLIKNVLVINNSTEANNRIEIRDELIPIQQIPRNKAKSATELPPIDLSKNYAFKIKAEVSPLKYQGQALMATHVCIEQDFAFVSYNTRGDVYCGGVEIYNVTDIRHPGIVSLGIFPKADISSLCYSNGKLFVVGAMENHYDYNFPYPAFLEVFSLNNKKEIDAVDTIIGLTSYTATDITVSQDNIFVTTGSNGHLIVLDKNYNLLKQIPVPCARAVDFNNQKAYVLAGEPGKIFVYDTQTASMGACIETGGATLPECKSGISVTDDYIFAALNEEGMKMLDKEGLVKQHIPKPLTPAGALDENHVTNNVSINNQLVLLANGESGIYVGASIPENDDNISLLGSMAFNGSPSANLVESKDNLIFVASGTGGLKIIGISIDEGIPDDIIPSETCPQLLDAISNMFPQGQNANTAHPDLFYSANAPTIKTTEETPVYVVFVDEGAIWKNTFGYYAYPTNNPPASVNDIISHVVFPNVSKTGEGGGLEQGDMVLLDTFPAGYTIGFYMIAKSWQNGMMVPGIYTHYSTLEFNPQNRQQHLLFIESNCNDLVFTLEDVRLPDGDKDFNDIILLVKDNAENLPNSKFDYTNIPVKP